MTPEEQAALDAEEAQKALDAEEQEKIDRGDYLEEDKPDEDADKEGDADADDESDDSEGSDEGSDEDSDEQDDTDDDESDGDESGDSDADDDEDESEDGNDPPEDSKKNHRIPKSRLDEVITQREDLKDANELLREENELLRNRKPGDPKPAPKTPDADVFDVVAKETEYAEALIDGDVEAAMEIRKEITAEQQKVWTADVTASVQEDILQNQQQSDMMSVIDEATKVYPFLKSGEGVNEEAVTEIMDMHDYFVEKKGMSMADAMVKAVKMIAPTYDTEDVEDNDPPPTPSAPDKDKEAADKRKAAAVKKNLKLKQPPSPNNAGVGERSTDAVKDVDSMTEEEFDAIPDSELKKMRK